MLICIIHKLSEKFGFILTKFETWTQHSTFQIQFTVFNDNLLQSYFKSYAFQIINKIFGYCISSDKNVMKF